MKKIKLTKEEKAIEDRLESYLDVGATEFKKMAKAIASRKKDAVLNIRVNRFDLEDLKKKARQLGIKYQTFISEILHRVAQGRP